jgi:hypothetical protein
MCIKLWLDDVRPAPEGFIWVKTAEEAILHLTHGMVSYISFDHDLGVGKTGYDVASFIENRAYYYKGSRNKIDYDIHSSNPVGRLRIFLAMESAKRFWKEGEIYGKPN